MKLVMLCGPGDTSAAVANSLREEFGHFPIIIEKKESYRKLLRRRANRLGLLRVFGQVAFVLLISPIMKHRSKRRYFSIIRNERINISDQIFEKAIRVESVNSKPVEDWLVKYQPDIVVVNGTRIISKSVLESIFSTFINIHCGITPKYRGSHGGYWARVHGDDQRCGVTVHIVDSGVDTGKIFGQLQIHPTHLDNITTYPLLQVSAALPVLKAAIRGEINPYDPEGESGIWYHPTFWGYLFHAFRRRIW